MRIVGVDRPILKVHAAIIKLHSQERRFEGIRIPHEKVDYSIFNHGLEFSDMLRIGKLCPFFGSRFLIPYGLLAFGVVIVKCFGNKQYKIDYFYVYTKMQTVFKN